MTVSTIHVGHSPDPDDAFMFYALTFAKLDTAPERYEHHLIDIETLNREAESGKHEVTAFSFHAYAYVADKYQILPHGASFGDGYGPILVSKTSLTLPSPRRGEGEQRPDFAAARAWLAGKTIAIPGTRTSAFLALHLFARDEGSTGPDFKTVVVPFDQIIPLVAAGKYDGGVIIHEGQLTYHQDASGGLKKVVDLGAWWGHRTGLPLPLGGNGVRRDLGPERMARISKHLYQSIQWGLAHRDEALGYALKYARGMDKAQADKFVGMYVNQYTLAYGEKGRRAVQLFLDEGARIGVLKKRVQAVIEE